MNTIQQRKAEEKHTQVKLFRQFCLSSNRPSLLALPPFSISCLHLSSVSRVCPCVMTPPRLRFPVDLLSNSLSILVRQQLSYDCYDCECAHVEMSCTNMWGLLPPPTPGQIPFNNSLFLHFLCLVIPSYCAPAHTDVFKSRLVQLEVNRQHMYA